MLEKGIHHLRLERESRVRNARMRNTEVIAPEITELEAIARFPLAEAFRRTSCRRSWGQSIETTKIPGTRGVLLKLLPPPNS
jgi:hypothetical protein